MSEYISDKNAQLKKIRNGQGIQYILDKAYHILGNPIMTHDMEYKAIAYTEMTVTDDPIWNEFEATGMVGHDRILFYDEENFLETAANAKTIAFLHSDRLKYDRIYGKLFTNNNIQVGCACIVECYKPFDDNDPEIFEAVCDILTKEFCMIELYQNHGQAYMESLVGQLIEDRVEDIALNTAHLESIYIGLESYLRLVVVDISRCDAAHTELTYFRDLFKREKPDFKYVIYENYILIIMSSNSMTLRIENLNKFYTLFEQNNLYAGMSSIFEKIFDLPQYYKQAVDALNHGLNVLKNDSAQRIFLYDEIK